MGHVAILPTIAKCPFDNAKWLSLLESALRMVIWLRVPDTCRISDLMGMDMRIIFYLWVTFVLDPN
jgi:hypothetical protein